MIYHYEIKSLDKLNMIVRSVIILFLFILLLSSCLGRRYTITKEYIQSNFPMEDSPFDFKAILIDSIGEENYPVKYKVKEESSVIMVSENLKAKKRIYFYKETPNYEWFNTTKGVISKVLTIKMKRNSWYQISTLMSSFGNQEVEYFLYINNKGELKIFKPKIISNW